MTPDALRALTVKELRRLARARGLSGYSRLRKAELVDRIAGCDATVRSPEPEAAQGSSPVAAAPAPQPADGVDQGPPLPERYGQDRLSLMVQDPTHLFAYWELDPRTVARKQAEMGEDGVPVLVVHSRYGPEQRVVDLAGGRYYVCVRPDTTYRADIGLRDRGGHIHVLASSEPARVPSDHVSDRTDERWRDSDRSFGELLDRAGLLGSIGSSAGLGGERRDWSETVAGGPSSFDLGASETVARGRS